MEREQPTELIAMRDAMSEFEVVLRGYDRGQVREAIERLDVDVRIALTDRDAAVARSGDLASQLSATHAEMESLRRKLASTQAPTFETMGERIAHMLRLAEEEAAEIRRAAHADITALREQAAGQREQAAQLEQQTAAQAETIIWQAQQQADALLAEAQGRADELARAGADHRQQADEDFEIALRERRADAARIELERRRSSTEEAEGRLAEADRLLTEARASTEQTTVQAREQADQMTAGAEAEAARIVQEAQARGQALVEQAEAETRRLQELQEQTLQQLQAVRALLGSLPGESLPGESLPGESLPGESLPAE